MFDFILVVLITGTYLMLVVFVSLAWGYDGCTLIMIDYLVFGDL